MSDGNIHLIKDRFVNIYLIEEAHQLSVIDAGFHGSGPKRIFEKIAAIGRQPRDLKYVLITHADPDHTGGAAELALKTGAAIVASSTESKMIEIGKPGREIQGNGLVKLLFGLIGGKTPRVMVNHRVDDGGALPVLGELRAIASPGHTPGHIAWFAPENGVLFAGDALRSNKGKLEFVRAPVQWDYDTGTQSVQKLLSLQSRTVYCGHGAPVNL
jgi:glyoxylase-like metal-dependent hydrolase (beta-lactamase superfamily II)